MDYEKKPINELKKFINGDYLEIKNAEDMPGMIDSTIALDLLISTKESIKNCAIALSETSNPETRVLLKSMLHAEVDLHTDISNLMMSKGWFHPYEVKKQFQIDGVSADMALQIAKLDLFPGDPTRLGTFATPNY